MNVLLSGVVGSTAYGLAHEGSDVDRLGIFAAPTEDVLGLRAFGETHVTTKPDVAYHEARKFCRLALAGNPTVMELLWLPDELYETRIEAGEQLINIRTAFLSAPQVRNAYFGYAVQQFKKLQERGDGSFGPDLRKRTAKHARHLIRLLTQGFIAWEYGEILVRLENPEGVREFGERVAGGDIAVAHKLLADFEHLFNTTRTVLPDKPEEETVNAWLLDVRREFY